jgi:DNA-binding beta-propeller fold protein YncE
MRKITTLLALAALAALFALTGCSEADNNPLSPNSADKKARGAPSIDSFYGQRGDIVVANRGSGSISVIGGKSGELRGTYMLPYADGENMPEPMYVNGIARMKKVFVGDRANDRVVVFDASNYEVIGTVPAGQGVFHQWIDRQGKQLWVNNDIDNTVTVINPNDLSVITTIDIPADLVAMGGKPHDVVLDHRGRYGYVTVLGIDGPSDYLLQFDALSYTEMNRQPVGKDPHLAIGTNTDLYVPSQDSGTVLVFDPQSLELLESIHAPGAHGAAVSPNNRFFYTTNLPGGGNDAIFTIKTMDNSLVGQPVSTPHPVPHNLALSGGGRMLFVTHSGGMADKVTIYKIHAPTGLPTFWSEVTVGTNPFGIGYVF